MKLGMMDVGIFCRESRFGISTEKGRVPERSVCNLNAATPKLPTSKYTAAVFCDHVPTLCSVLCFYLRLQYHQVPKSYPGSGGPQAELSLPVLH